MEKYSNPMIYTLGALAPKLANSAFVAPSAQVIGLVELEEEASVWFGAVVRGDTEPIRVGPKSNLQDGVIVHTDPGYPCHIGRECVVGHRAVLHGCRLGDGVLVGMGAVVLNGAILEDECAVGAGALVAEGAILERGWLYLGVPAKPRRALTERERAATREGAARYVARARHFQDSLSPLPGRSPTPGEALD